MKRNLSMLLLLLISLLFLSFWQMAGDVLAQQQKLTLGQILTGLQTNGKTAETNTLAKRNVYIAKKVRQNEVTFILSPEFESELRNTGANDELIQAIREVNSYTLSKSGDTHFEKEEYDSAIRDYTKAIEFNPKRDLVYRDRAWAYYQKREYNLAINDLNKAIEIDPKYPDYYNRRGVVYYAKGENEQAIHDFTKAIELSGNRETIYTNRGNAYENIEDYESAAADYRKALEIKPDYERAKTGLERVLKKLE